MNREIKFRAWDKKAKKYVERVSHNFMHDAVRHTEPERYVFEQFTGRKQNNGKEIYEGDIIEGLHDFGPGGFHKRKFVVSFHNEKGYQWKYWDLYSLKVIGNKHENPDRISSSGGK